MNQDIKKHIDELVELLNKASYEYHTLDKPTITDQEYDNYLHELVGLEEKYPEFFEDNIKDYDFDNLDIKRISYFILRIFYI